MNVCFYFAAAQEKDGGINRYSKGIVEALDNNIIKKYTFNDNNFDLENMKRLHHNYTSVKNMDHIAREEYFLSKAHGIDIFHSFYPLIPVSRYKDVRTTLTIHDVVPLINKEWCGSSEITFSFFKNELFQEAQRVDRVITNSEYTKSTVVDYYGIKPENITVVYPGVEPAVDEYKITEEDSCLVRQKYNIDKDYILSICTLEPRKNLISLIRAYEIYREKHILSDVKLVLTGKLGWKFDGILESIKLSKFSKDIILTDYVTDEELAILYTDALCFAYVSYYEGFGTPILEALSKGKAVLSSKTTSMPEAGGNAACYCDPYDIDSIYSGLERLIEDATYRKSLEEKAVIHASKFSYKKSAQVLLNVFEELA